MDSEFTAAAAKPVAAPLSEPKGLKVAMPFNTHVRRFKASDDVVADDLAGSALDLEHLKKRGFIVAA